MKRAEDFKTFLLWTVSYATAVENTSMQRNFYLPGKKYSLKIYAAVAMLSLGFSKGSKMDSAILIKPLQNIRCLPQIPA